MSKALSRDFLPTGRRSEAANLVELARDNGVSIDAELISSGLKKLGHVSQRITSPNFSQNLARDLGYYRQTEALLNVFNENEKIDRLS